MTCLACLLETKLPHNKIRSILTLLKNLGSEMEIENIAMRETSKKLSIKYATVLKLLEEESTQNDQTDFVLMRISTVTVSSVTTTTTTTTITEMS